MDVYGFTFLETEARKRQMWVCRPALKQRKEVMSLNPP